MSWLATVRRAGDVVDRHPSHGRRWFYAGLIAIAVVEVALVVMVVVGLSIDDGAELAVPAAAGAVLLPIGIGWAVRSAARGEVGAFGRSVDDVRRGRWPGDPT